jgi:hypothetical protein
MPLHRDGRLVWIIAPRCLTARRLADPQQPAPAWLKPFRLTSSGDLQRFVLRHAQRALGQRGSEGLHRALPLFSNAPRRRGWRSKVAVALVVLADIFLGAAPATTIGLFGTALCLIFLATAALRLWSAFPSDKPPKRSREIDDRKLPLYTIICPLNREAAVVGDLVDAIRALDYPGIMAQTPANERPDALFVAPDAFFTSRAVQFATLAARERIPASYSARDLVTAGGLTSYGTDLADMSNQVGFYAGKILKGAKPADLPVTQLTKFEFVINLQTARTLGIEVPPAVLSIADEVIE